MKKYIHKAVENLPEELITQDIANAAIEEANIELLDTLPHKFLTGEVILAIIEKNNSGYSWQKFNLENIPEHLRTLEVCEYAVRKEESNILYTPSNLLNENMLSEMMCNVESKLKYLHLFPNTLWSMPMVVRGIKSIYSKTTQQYGPRGGYHGTRTTTDLKPVAIFLSYVPAQLKKEQLFVELFNTGMAMGDIDVLTPDKLKDKAYYLKIAEKDFSLVPERFYDYDILLTAIKSGKISLSEYSSYSYYRNDPKVASQKEHHDKIREKAFKVMDSAMANAAVEQSPTVFKYLPKKFQTPNRLMIAIQKAEHENIVSFDGNEHLFTEPVCKAYIYRNRDIPQLPADIWTADFVDCCVTYGSNFKWFEQLPKELQTLEIVEKAMRQSDYNARYVRPELITLERAQELYRPNDKWDKNRREKEYVPAHYIKDFCTETGLSEEFFGGEVGYHKLRENRGSYTYCRLGHSFIGFIDESGYNSKNYRIVLTRRTPASIKPVQIFEQYISTFHATWLEKLIADNDPAYTKPAAYPKAEKIYQTNGYFKLEKVVEVEGTAIYANSLLGEKVMYIAEMGGVFYQDGSLKDLKERLTTKNAA